MFVLLVAPALNCVTDGPLHTVFTVTSVSTTSLSVIVQVKVREELMNVASSGEGVMITAIGGGTIMQEYYISVISLDVMISCTYS